MNPLPKTKAVLAFASHPLSRILGCVTAGIGGLVLLGWIGDIHALKSILPGLVAVKANTAVCFLLAGVALGLKAKWGVARVECLPGEALAKQDRAQNRVSAILANLCAALVVLIGLLTLCEYTFGWNLGIDQLLFQEPATAVETSHPGRMALPTALNFLLLGDALLLLGTRHGHKAVPWLTVVSTAVAGLALGGYLYDLPFLAKLGPFTPIAAPTAFTFLVLCAGMLLADPGGLAHKMVRKANALGFAFALVLLLLLGGAVVRNTLILIQHARWVAHTYEVSDKLSDTLAAVADVETGTRGYVLTGDKSFLEPYLPAPAKVRQLVQELRKLTSDNPSQQSRLDRLELLTDQKIAIAAKHVALRDQGDVAGAAASIATGRGKRIMDAIRGAVGEMEQEEGKLLQEREARVETSTVKTLLTLVLGMLVSLGLLLAIFISLHREIAQRQQTEAALQQAHDELELRVQQRTAALRESEAHFRFLVEGVKDYALYLLDPAGRVVTWNSGAKRLKGYRAEEIIGQPFSRFYPAEDVAAGKPDRALQVATAEGRYEEEGWRVRKDGSRFWANVVFTALRDEAGGVQGFAKITRDSTERKQSEKELRLLGAALDSAANAIVITDRGGSINWVNPAFTLLTGYASEEVLGHNPRILKSGKQDQLLYEGLWKTILAGKVWKGEIVNRRKDGSLYEEEQTITPVRDMHGEITNFIAIKQNITERKRAEEALQASYEELQTLHEIGQTVLSSPDLKSILEGILDKALSIGSFDIGNIRLLDPKSKFLQVVASRGYRNTGDHKSHSINPKDPTAAGLQIAAFNGFQAYTVKNVPATPGLRTLKREGVHSASLIPIRAEDQILGTILLGSRTPREFLPHEVRLLETLGSQLGIAVQRAWLYEETQKNLERIGALHEIDKAITSTLDLRTILDILLEKTDRLLPFVAATTVRLLNRETEALEPVACRNIDEKEWKAATAGMSIKGLARLLPEKSAPVMTLNAQTDPRSLAPDFLRKCGLVSSLRVPLVAKDEVLGALTFFTKEEHQFTNEEVEFLTTLAGQAAIAINNSHLYEQIGSSSRELELTNHYLERSLRQLSSLYTALTPLTPSESTHAMLDGIIERLMEATGADAALIRLRDNATGALPIASQRGFPDHYLKSVEMIVPGSSADRVYSNGEVIIASDIASEPRLKGKVQLQVGLHSCAMLPLKVFNEVRGIVHLASRKLGYFDEEQRDHLITIARQMGIALENKELFENLRASRDELEKANKIKDEFLSVMSHELRTPLNVVVGYTGMIKDGLMGAINQQQQEALGKVIGRANDQLNMVNNILYATVLETEKINVDVHEVSLGDFLSNLKAAYETPINKDFTLEWDYPADLPVVKADSAKLKQIMQNLIDNAIKFTKKGNVTISANIRHEATGERQQEEGLLAPHASGLTPSDPHASRLSPHAFVEFKVADTGVGIPPDALPFIFEKFRQADSSETRLFGGVGMGLYIVKKFAELLKGKIGVETEPGKGSTFTVTIPY